MPEVQPLGAYLVTEELEARPIAVRVLVSGESARSTVRLHGVADEDIAGALDDVRNRSGCVAGNRMGGNTHATTEVKRFPTINGEGRFHLAANGLAKQGFFLRLAFGVGE